MFVVILGKKKRKKMIKKYNKNETNPLWKGDKVGYNALHGWIKRHKPKSIFCEKCGKITDKLDCANISGEYKRDISDFRWLCRKCHMEEDGRLKKLRISLPTRKKLNGLYICSICKKFKNKDCFNNHKTNKDGIYSYCKECRKIKRRKRYLKTKESSE